MKFYLKDFVTLKRYAAAILPKYILDNPLALPYICKMASPLGYSEFIVYNILAENEDAAREKVRDLFDPEKFKIASLVER